MDELDRQIASILAAAELPAGSWAIARVREDVDIAADCAKEVAGRALLTEDAKALLFAAKTILRLATECKLERPQDLAVIRRLGTEANVRLACGGKPERHAWLGPCIDNFHAAWEALTDRPSGIHYRDDPSPTLKFTTDCCALIDPSVNVSLVKREYDKFRKVEHMTHEEYVEFCQSDLWKKLTRSAL